MIYRSIMLGFGGMEGTYRLSYIVATISINTIFWLSWSGERMSKKSIKLSKVNAEHVIRESCKRYGHAGVDDTLAIIREKWNLSPNREFVEKLIRENENA